MDPKVIMASAMKFKRKADQGKKIEFKEVLQMIIPALASEGFEVPETATPDDVLDIAEKHLTAEGCDQGTLMMIRELANLFSPSELFSDDIGLESYSVENEELEHKTNADITLVDLL